MILIFLVTPIFGEKIFVAAKAEIFEALAEDT